MARLQNNEDILSEFKINPVVKKTQNYRNKLIRHVRRKDRQTGTLNYELLAVCGTPPRTTLKKTYIAC